MQSENRNKIRDMEHFLNNKQIQKVRTDFLERILTIVIAGMGLIAVLAWDDALKHLFQNIFSDTGQLAEEFIYAVVVTLCASIVTVFFSKKIIQKRKKEKDSEIS